MMSFVVVTKENNAIVIDGGRHEDMPLLKQYVDGRHIAAWILTHPHIDHISGFVSEYKKNKLAGMRAYGIYDASPEDYTSEMISVSDKYIQSFKELLDA